MNTDFSKTDFTKFSDEAIEFAFNESNKLMQETLVSFRAITDKSYVAFAMIVSAFVYYLQRQDNSTNDVIVLVACAISMLMIWFNLMPSQVNFIGQFPNQTIHMYHEQIEKPNQHREMQTTLLIAHNKSIAENISIIQTRTRRFKQSVIVAVCGFILSFLLSFFGL